MLEKCRSAKIKYPFGAQIYLAEVLHDYRGNIRLMTSIDLPFYANEVYPVTFLDPVLGLVECKCNLAAPVKASDDKCSYFCSILEVVKEEQRRQDLKVTVSRNIDIICITFPSGSERPLSSRFPAVTKNISAGGVCFTCDQLLPVETRLRFTFDGVERKLQLIAKVLWCKEETSPGGKILYTYGCSFLNLDSDTEEGLRCFVYQQELNAHRAKML